MPGVTVAGVLLLAVVDSINPSAIVVTLYLLSASQSRVVVQVGVYLGAIAATYFALGAVLLLGLDAFLPSAGDALRGRAGLVVQSLVGLALLLYSLSAPTHGAPAQAVARPSAGTYLALVVLGITVTAMELPTALPYFGAIALIAEAGLPPREWVPLLALYNLIFVLPPLALLVGHVVLGRRLGARYEALRTRLEGGARETALWIAGLVGGALLVTGVIELVARLR
ncbi:MAG: GAP family protein [Vicinamibacterales bacterium]